MSETYENACAGCQEKFKKALCGVMDDMLDAANSKGDILFHLGIACGKLSYIIAEMPDKEEKAQ